MYAITKERNILNGIYQFKEQISIETNGISPTILNDVISLDPRVSYYLGAVSASIATNGFGSRLLINITYKNKETSLSDIHVISSEKEIHSLLCQNIGNYKKHFVLLSDSPANVEAAYQRFMVANAAFYSNFIGAKITGMAASDAPFLVYDFELLYRVGQVKLSMMEKETSDEVKKIAALLFVPGLNDEAKIYLAHNYLATSIKYTLKEDASILERSYIQSAYGALIKKQCVCQGFAEAFKRLMDECKIDCDVVCGQVGESSAPHAWNIVRLNNGADCFHIDATWDSNHNLIIYDYFGKDDLYMSRSRVWNRQYTPACNSTKNLLRIARGNLNFYKSALIRNGISERIID